MPDYRPTHVQNAPNAISDVDEILQVIAYSQLLARVQLVRLSVSQVFTSGAILLLVCLGLSASLVVTHLLRHLPLPSNLLRPLARDKFPPSATLSPGLAGTRPHC